MKTEFMENYSRVMGKEYHNLGTRRYQLALRLYYRELEALLKLVSPGYFSLLTLSAVSLEIQMQFLYRYQTLI